MIQCAPLEQSNEIISTDELKAYFETILPEKDAKEFADIIYKFDINHDETVQMEGLVNYFFFFLHKL